MFKKLFLPVLVSLFFMFTVTSGLHAEEGDMQYGFGYEADMVQMVDQVKNLQQLEGIVPVETIQMGLSGAMTMFGAMQPILQMMLTVPAMQTMIPMVVNPMESAIYVGVGPIVEDALGEKPVQIDGYELRDLINKYPNMQLIDVRTPAEHEQIRIPGSKSIPLEKIDAALRDGKINKKDPLVFLCQSGFRAYMAGLLANTYGYRNVYNLEGGTIGGWVELDLPTEGTLGEGEEIISGGC